MIAKVNEVFSSPQGEGLYNGCLMHFVRFYGCNLDCSWCDQPSALTTRPGHHYREMDTEEIVQTILPHHLSVPVCFTGGEPTYQHQALIECIDRLREQDKPYRLVTLESNGTIFLSALTEDPNLFLSCSPKFEGTRTDNELKAFGQKALLDWIEGLTWMTKLQGEHPLKYRMQLKFVIENEQWFDDILRWLEKNVVVKQRIHIPLVFQPEWFKGREEFTRIVKKYSDSERYHRLADLGFANIRFQPQAHKLIHVR